MAPEPEGVKLCDSFEVPGTEEALEQLLQHEACCDHRLAFPQGARESIDLGHDVRPVSSQRERPVDEQRHPRERSAL